MMMMIIITAYYGESEKMRCTVTAIVTAIAIIVVRKTHNKINFWYASNM